ncbi:MAG: ornithine carbamoyltransferase [Anaerolineales bacterium]|nr:ornithine carbamoyltransferase [Anaerolineales bacterium]
MQHFLAISDLSSQELNQLVDLAIDLKREWRSGGNDPILESKVLAMVFQKPSLRTRVSFDMAMRHLGGDALYLSPNEIGFGKREAISDVSRVLSGYVDAIMARVFAHDHILELAEYASVPVINGLSDFNHPCQALADVLTIKERFGSFDDLRVAFIGDGNNVAVSLLHSCALLGMDFVIATPEGYQLPRQAVEIAEDLSSDAPISIEELQDPEEAARGAHVIYTDTWVSMGQEEETKRRLEVFPPFQVNQELLGVADNGAIVMHCLPAHRGEEITDDVADGPQSAIFPQAENRMHAQKAVLVELLS